MFINKLSFSPQKGDYLGTDYNSNLESGKFGFLITSLKGSVDSFKRRVKEYEGKAFIPDNNFLKNIEEKLKIIYLAYLAFYITQLGSNLHCGPSARLFYHYFKYLQIGDSFLPGCEISVSYGHDKTYSCEHTILIFKNKAQNRYIIFDPSFLQYVVSVYQIPKGMDHGNIKSLLIFLFIYSEDLLKLAFLELSSETVQRLQDQNRSFILPTGVSIAADSINPPNPAQPEVSITTDTDSITSQQQTVRSREDGDDGDVISKIKIYFSKFAQLNHNTRDKEFIALFKTFFNEYIEFIKLLQQKQNSTINYQEGNEYISMPSRFLEGISNNR